MSGQQWRAVCWENVHQGRLYEQDSLPLPKDKQSSNEFKLDKGTARAQDNGIKRKGPRCKLQKGLEESQLHPPQGTEEDSDSRNRCRKVEVKRHQLTEEELTTTRNNRPGDAEVTKLGRAASLAGGYR